MIGLLGLLLAWGACIFIVFVMSKILFPPDE